MTTYRIEPRGELAADLPLFSVTRDGEHVCALTHAERAKQVADLLAFDEREALGYPPGDERIMFAERPEPAAPLTSAPA